MKITMNDVLPEFDNLNKRIIAMFQSIDRTNEIPKSIMEVFVILPTYAQLSVAAKSNQEDEDLISIIRDGSKILKSAILEMIELQPKLAEI